jgi:hypothetical protein
LGKRLLFIALLVVFACEDEDTTPDTQPPPKGFKQEPHIRGVFCFTHSTWIYKLFLLNILTIGELLERNHI